MLNGLASQRKERQEAREQNSRFKLTAIELETSHLSVGLEEGIKGKRKYGLQLDPDWEVVVWRCDEFAAVSKKNWNAVLVATDGFISIVLVATDGFISIN